MPTLETSIGGTATPFISSRHITLHAHSPRPASARHFAQIQEIRSGQLGSDQIISSRCRLVTHRIYIEEGDPRMVERVELAGMRTFSASQC